MTTCDVQEFREIFPPFRNTSRRLIESMLASARCVVTPENTRMRFEGRLYQGIEFVVAGEKRVYKSSGKGREITLYEVGPGEVCILNMTCVLSNTPSPVSAVATTEVRSLVVAAQDFRKLVAEYEELRSYIFAAVSQRFDSMVELLGEVTFEKMDKRLLNYLVEKSEDGQLTLTHQQIANELGTAREVVSRLLNTLQHRGKVRLSRGYIRLTELHVND